MTLSYNFFPFFQFHFKSSISFPCSFFLLYLIVVFLKYPLLITNILACQIYTYWNICLYFSDVFKTNKLVNSFQDILLNIFEPLFEVTNDPKSHPELHAFLQHVSDGYFLEHYWFQCNLCDRHHLVISPPLRGTSEWHTLPTSYPLKIIIIIIKILFCH